MDTNIVLNQTYMFTKKNNKDWMTACKEGTIVIVVKEDTADYTYKCYAIDDGAQTRAYWVKADQLDKAGNLLAVFDKPDDLDGFYLPLDNGTKVIIHNENKDRIMHKWKERFGTLMNCETQDTGEAFVIPNAWLASYSTEHGSIEQVPSKIGHPLVIYKDKHENYFIVTGEKNKDTWYVSQIQRNGTTQHIVGGKPKKDLTKVETTMNIE